ncbi:hypothetical protein DE146DRAFT_614494, partial [Phaeosphaeria sp. MPI-PUGE-AT-0046c]
FVFSLLDTTPEHTPDSLAPSSSHSNLSDVASAIDNSPGGYLVELLDEQIKLKNGLSAAPHFRRNLGQAQALIRVHGPYTRYIGTSVFSRSPIARDCTKEVSIEEIADSLQAAQGCVGDAQPEGPAKEDLAMFQHLWHVAVSILDAISRTGDLDLEILGWGVFGMCAGHVVHDLRHEEEAFLLLKKRLHVALRAMPSLDAPIRKKEVNLANISGASITSLTKANREIHVCANLLLQQFRREDYERIQWYYGISIASRWIQHLGLDREG